MREQTHLPFEELGKKAPKFSLYAGILFSAAAFLIGVRPQWLVNFYGHGSSGDASQIGELVGGVAGALLSIAGILLVLQAILDQQRDYRIQRAELKATRLIHHEQQFSAIFFQLLNAFNELLKSFEYRNSFKEIVTGKMCLKELHRDFSNQCAATDSENVVLEKYRQFIKENQLTLKQFNQYLQMVLSFTLDEKDDSLKKKFASFIGAQLSYYEEFFLLLCLAADPKSRFPAEKVREFELFDFEPEPPFEFLSKFTSKTS